MQYGSIQSTRYYEERSGADPASFTTTALCSAQMGTVGRGRGTHLGVGGEGPGGAVALIGPELLEHVTVIDLCYRIVSHMRNVGFG